jgi:P-type conjugative transfer protein TrbJ
LTEELISDAKQAQQYVTQLSQYATQMAQYRTQITNTVALRSTIWSNVTSDIMQIRNLTNEASLLAGNSGSILTKLQSASAYANQAANLPSNMENQFTQWQQTLARAGLSMGQTLGVQQTQLTNYSALQAAIQAHGQTAGGQMQAIEAGVEMAGLTNTQLQQIQTTLTAQAQLQATKVLTNADRRASEDAETQAFVSGANVPTTGYQGF